MATPASDGEIGGKFRKRPFRRAAATPYDRPPSAAARGGLRGLSGNGGGGWLSKLVDPASRLITVGASRIFASFFRKRLPAPLAVPEENQQSRQAVAEVASTNLSSDVPDQGGSGVDIHPANSSDIGVPELEELLKQKTFTRVEFEHLMELLHSRTVEPVDLERAVNDEIKEKGNAPARENIESSGLYENMSTPASRSTIPKDEAASPTELAKAYMGSRPLKVSPSTLCLRSQEFQEDTRSTVVPHLSKTSNLPISGRSTTCYPKTPLRVPDNVFQTLEYQGRSGMTRMSCSPYFKINPTTNKKVLKRGSTDFDTISGSFGPIRRIRQKSSLISSKYGQLIPLFKAPTGNNSPLHKSSWFDASKSQSIDFYDAENKADKTYAKVTPIPPKSSEAAMKILQHLDKMVPSPKEKLSERKSIAWNESHSKVKHDILAEVTPKRLQDVDTNNETHLLSQRKSLSEKHCRLERNVVSKSFAVSSAAMPSIDAKTGGSYADIAISGFAKIHSLENSVFQIGAREDSSVRDKDESNLRDASAALSADADRMGPKLLGHNSSISETASEKCPTSLSKSMHTSSSIRFREADMNASSRSVSADKGGFKFFTETTSISQLPSTSLLGRSALNNEQSTTFFNFSSKAAQTVFFPSTTVGVNSSAGLNTGASDAPTDSSHNEKGVVMQQDRDVSGTFGNAVSRGIAKSASPALHDFGSSIISPINGSLPLSPLTSSAYSAPAEILFDSGLSSSFSTSTATTSSTSRASVLSSAPTFLTEKSLQFCSSSDPAPVSISHIGNESNPKSSEVKPEVSAFGTNSSMAPFVSTFSEASTSSSSAHICSSAFSSFDSSASAPVTTVAFSTTHDSFALAASSTFFSTGKDSSGSSSIGQHTTLSYGSENSAGSLGGAAESISGSQLSQPGSKILKIPQTSQLGLMTSSPTFGLSKPFSSGFGCSPSVSATFGTKTFTNSLSPIGSSGPVATTSTVTAAGSNLFRSSSQPSTSSVFGFTFTSSTSSTGLSPGTSASCSSLAVGSSTGPVLSFSSSGSAPSSASAQPVFGIPLGTSDFCSGSPGNDQMNVEGSMTDDINRATVPTVSTFGQSANSIAAPNPMFVPTVPGSGSPFFQFTSSQSPSIPQASQFQAGNLGTPSAGNFNIGSGGGDKAGRRILKVRQNKLRKR